MMLLEDIDKLKEVVKLIQSNPRRAYPRWVFDLENISRRLMDIFKQLSLEKGLSGKLSVEDPELNGLRRAILKLSTLTTSGGWSISLEFILNTIFSSIKDLEEQMLFNIKKSSDELIQL